MGHITVDRISEVGHITLHSLLLVSVLILPSVGYLLWLAAATVDQCFWGMVCRIVLPLPLLIDVVLAPVLPLGAYILLSMVATACRQFHIQSCRRKADKTCFEASSFNLFVTAGIFSWMLAVHFVLDFCAELTQAWPGAKIMLCQSEGSKHTLLRLNWTLFR